MFPRFDQLLEDVDDKDDEGADRERRNVGLQVMPVAAAVGEERLSVLGACGDQDAEKNAAEAGFGDRIKTIPCNVLDETTEFPQGADAVWMSQFLDCFSLEQITKILTKIHRAATQETDVYVLEPLWDKQRFEAAAYSLQATSLYFTCIANGNSKMYRFAELKQAIEDAGFELKEAHHNIGPNAYSLLRFRIK